MNLVKSIRGSEGAKAPQYGCFGWMRRGGVCMALGECEGEDERIFGLPAQENRSIH